MRHLLTPFLLAAVAVPLLAAPASATKGPDSREDGVHGQRLACTGDTVHVSAVVRGQRDVGPATIVLQAGAGGAWSTVRSTSVSRTKTGSNRWTLDASGLGADVTLLRAEIRAAGQSLLTATVPVTSCAPGTEVPEVPVAALLPLTLVATAAGVLALTTRRTASLPA